MNLNYFKYLKILNYIYITLFANFPFFTLLVPSIELNIPSSVNKALIEFSQIYAYAYVYSYMHYYPFWITLFFALTAAFAVWFLYSIYFNLEPGINDFNISFMFFIYIFIKLEFPYKNCYALRVNETSLLIYNKIILELSKIDEDARKNFYEEFYSIYLSDHIPNELKILFFMQIIEKLL